MSLSLGENDTVNPPNDPSGPEEASQGLLLVAQKWAPAKHSCWIDRRPDVLKDLKMRKNQFLLVFVVNALVPPTNHHRRPPQR